MIDSRTYYRSANLVKIFRQTHFEYVELNMVLCWAFGCNHYNVRETCKFFRFPNNQKLRAQWIKLLRRNEEPGPGAYVCSCHFQDGLKENLPKIHSFNKEKALTPHYLTPEKKKRTVQHTDQIPSTSTQQISDENDETTNPVGLELDVENPIEKNLNIAINQYTQTNPTDVLLSPTVLEAENYLLQMSLEREQRSHHLERFTYDSIANNDKLILLYTGLPQTAIFDALYGLLENIEITYISGFNVEIINKRDQLLLTLMKLRQNFPHADLALRFQISESTVSNIVVTWIHVLYETLYQQLMTNIPSRQKNKSCLPNCFSTFTNCRIILDCTEIFVVTSRKSLLNQKLTYSSYKHRNTFKGLVGTAPNGVITYISDLYPGSTSDKKIVEHCGILDKLVAGDLVIADKGFFISDILPQGVHLNIPPFLVNPQFTRAQIQQTQTIAKARILVERAIRRMKCYKILNLIPYTLTKYADIIFKVIGALTNLHYPQIKEVENLFSE